jgi:transposase
MEGCTSDLWSAQDAVQSSQALVGEGRLARRVRSAGGRGWSVGGGADRQYACEGASLGSGRKRGAHAQAIGISRGGRNTKLHAITDAQGRPLAFHLTPGQAADCRVADVLLSDLPARCIVHADRAYDSNRVRDLIESQQAVPNIPPKANRRWKSCFSRVLYKGRNAIERMFCRLKDCRRIATRYDRRADVFLGSIHLAAAITWWL